MFLVLSGVVSAQDTPPGVENELQYYPTPFGQGAWYDSSRSGSGVFMDRLQPVRGTTLTAVTYYTYTTSGAPLWLLATGQTTRPTPAGVISGDFGRFAEPTNDAHGGPCPNCAQISPQVGPSPWGLLELIYQSPYAARLRVGSVDTGVIRPSDFQFGQKPNDVLLGEWEGRILGRISGAAGVFNYDLRCSTAISTSQSPAPANVWERDPSSFYVPNAQTQWLKFTHSSANGSECWPLATNIASELGGEILNAVGLGASNEVRGPGQFGAPGPLLGYRVTARTDIAQIWINDQNTFTVWIRNAEDRNRVAFQARFTRRNPI